MLSTWSNVQPAKRSMVQAGRGTTLHPNRWVSSIISSGANRPEREVNHSHPSINEVKNEWSFTSACAFMAWTGTNFTITPCLKIQRIKRKISDPVCGPQWFSFTILNKKSKNWTLLNVVHYRQYPIERLFLVCVFQSVISYVTDWKAKVLNWIVEGF